MLLVSVAELVDVDQAEVAGYLTSAVRVPNSLTLVNGIGY